MVQKSFKKLLRHGAATAATALVLVFSITPLALAADYGCGTYGAGAYDSGEVCGASTTPGGGSSSGGNGLVNTGQALAIGIPAILILAGTLWMFRLRKKAHARQEINQNPDQQPPTQS